MSAAAMAGLGAGLLLVVLLIGLYRRLGRLLEEFERDLHLPW